MKILGYYNWLHGQWPAGKVEKLPVVGEDGSTNRDGIRIVGDLSGIPVAEVFLGDWSQGRSGLSWQSLLSRKNATGKKEGVVDIAIIGAGVSGSFSRDGSGKSGAQLRFDRNQRSLLHGEEFSQKVSTFSLIPPR